VLSELANSVNTDGFDEIDENLAFLKCMLENEKLQSLMEVCVITLLYK